MNRGVLMTMIPAMNNCSGTTSIEWLPALNKTICRCLTNVLNLSEKSCQFQCGPDIITLIQETIKSESVKGQHPICQAVTSRLICELWRSSAHFWNKNGIIFSPMCSAVWKKAKKSKWKGFIVLQPCHSRWNVITDVHSGDTVISKGRWRAERSDGLTQHYNSFPSFPKFAYQLAHLICLNSFFPFYN